MAGPLARVRAALGRGSTRRPPAPFVVGLTRSGTTLLRMMLDAHPALAVPPETHFVPDLIRAAREHPGEFEPLVETVSSSRTWGDFGISEPELRERLTATGLDDPGAAVRAFFAAYAERQGKPRWGDKTPAYGLSIVRIGRALEEARFVHLIRDGRDVALSQTERAINPQPPPAEQAERWVGRIAKTREQAQRLDGERYLEARYEDLVTDPEPALRRICDFVELDYDAAMLDYHRRAGERLTEMAGELAPAGEHAAQPAGYRIDNHAPTTRPPDPKNLERWRREMTPKDLAAYEGVAAELLAELGYPLSDEASAERTSSERMVER